MPKKNLIDEYIDNAQPFAQPILKHLKKLVYKACPNAQEKIKWGFPHFDYLDMPMVSMASFKAHCVFGFWKASLMNEPSFMENAKTEVSMGHYGKILSLNDLPSDKKIMAHIKKAMTLNENGIKVAKPKLEKANVPQIPDYFSKALRSNKDANTHFQKFSPSAQKEYINWLIDAKTETTQLKRLEQALEWIAEGKGKNWKYEVKNK